MPPTINQINSKPQTPNERGLPMISIDEINVTEQGIAIRGMIGDF